MPFAITIDFDTLGAGAAEGSDPALVGTVTLRDRDSTEQVRMPLADVPETLSKLCSAHPLKFADLMAAYGTGAAAASSSAAEGPEAMIEYFAQHGLTAKLNAAVNALGKAKPADPIAFLVKELQKK